MYLSKTSPPIFYLNGVIIGSAHRHQNYNDVVSAGLGVMAIVMQKHEVAWGKMMARGGVEGGECFEENE